MFQKLLIKLNSYYVGNNFDNINNFSLFDQLNSYLRVWLYTDHKSQSFLIAHYYETISIFFFIAFLGPHYKLGQECIMVVTLSYESFQNKRKIWYHWSHVLVFLESYACALCHTIWNLCLNVKFPGMLQNSCGHCAFLLSPLLLHVGDSKYFCSS